MSLQDNTAAMEVVQRANGRFAIRTIGSATLDDVQGDFASQREAEDFMLQRAMLRDEADEESDLLTPGGSQGIR